MILPLSSACEEGLEQICDGKMGIGADQAVLIQTDSSSLRLMDCVDRQENDGPSLLCAALAMAAWQKDEKGKTQGLLELRRECVSWFTEKNGLSLLLPRPQENGMVMENYGSHRIMEQGILPLQTHGESVHKMRRIDSRSLWLDSVLSSQGRVPCSPEGALCACRMLQIRKQLQAEMMVISEGGRLWIRPQGKHLVLCAPAVRVASGEWIKHDVVGLAMSNV